MASIVTHKFRQFNADQFRESLGEAEPSFLYMFIGRVTSWADDNIPPSPTDAFANTEFDFWRDMLSAKKVSTSDTSFAIPRNDWTSGTVYDEYDQTSGTLLTSVNGHYVVSSDFNVYKCLFNFNGGQSTSEPSGTSLSVITTADSYKWKYLYTISAADALKFITDDFIPVSQVGDVDDGSIQFLVEQAAANGSIDIIDVTAGGDPFTNYNDDTLASVSNSSVVTLGASASVAAGVYGGSTLYLTGGTGAGQQREIIQYTATSKIATLATGFSVLPDGSTTYSVAPLVTVTGDGSGTTAIATMNTASDTVFSITITSVGKNHSKATVVLSANGLSNATGFAYIPPPGGHGNNAIKELGGHNVIINTQFDKDENGKFTVVNDFRKIGLVRDPLLANSSPATALRYDQTQQITFTGASGTFLSDEVITGDTSGATGFVVEANTTVMKLSGVEGIFAGDTLTGSVSAVTATYSSTAFGELLPFTGELMYSEFRSPISRSEDQVESVKLIINF